MYPLTLIVQLTILFGTSCGILHGGDRLDYIAPRQVITPTCGLGVTGRCEIPEGAKESGVRVITCRKKPLLGTPPRQRVYDVHNPMADLGTPSDASCITHG
jgi:hypothetical protein